MWPGKSQVLQNGCDKAGALTAGLVCGTAFGQAQQSIFIIEGQDDKGLGKTFS